jgi:hypothetical protein
MHDFFHEIRIGLTILYELAGPRKKMEKKRQLSEEDQDRVNEYLSSGYNKTEKKPYHPWILLLILFLVVSAIGFFALWFTKFMGIE